jgi:hypothetical protein
MHLNRHALRVLLVLPMSVAASAAHAADPTKQECVEANDAAQDLRQAGKLRQAREKLTLCATASCPGVVRDDCTQRLAEVDSAVPHVVIAAKDAAGNDLVDVRVTVDGAPLTEKLDGASLKVDPGPRVFVFTWAGHLPVTKRLVLAEHDQARREVVVFGSAEAPRMERAIPAPASSGGSGIDRKTIGFAVGGAGVVGVVVGSIFGLVSKGTYDQASQGCRDGSGPCSTGDAQHSADAHTQATISTVGFVAGGVLLAGGAALYFTAPTGTVTVGPTAGGLVMRGSW